MCHNCNFQTSKHQTNETLHLSWMYLNSVVGQIYSVREHFILEEKKPSLPLCSVTNHNQSQSSTPREGILTSRFRREFKKTKKNNSLMTLEISFFSAAVVSTLGEVWPDVIRNASELCIVFWSRNRPRAFSCIPMSRTFFP